MAGPVNPPEDWKMKFFQNDFVDEGLRNRQALTQGGQYPENIARFGFGFFQPQKTQSPDVLAPSNPRKTNGGGPS